MLNFIGDDGYLEMARQVLDATRRIADGHRRDPRICACSAGREMNLVAFTSDTVSVFHIIDEMKAARLVHPAAARLPRLEGEHPPVDQPGQRAMGRALLADLRACVAIAKTLPSGAVAAGIREAFADVEPDQVTPEMLQQMLAMAGAGGDALPGRMEINEVLNALPAALTERLLTEYMNSAARAEGRGVSGERALHKKPMSPRSGAATGRDLIKPRAKPWVWPTTR